MKYLILVMLSFFFLNFAFSEEEEGQSAKVGPDKGIIQADEHEGFKLSAEALKNFDLKFIKVDERTVFSIPTSAIVYSGEEVNVFRVRDGFFKRIDFKTIRKTANEVTLSSEQLKGGDQIVVQGISFLRVAELSAFSSSNAGHAH